MTRTILIVDDDPMIRKLIATTLEDISGYRLQEAGDGLEAVPGDVLEGRCDQLADHRVVVDDQDGPRHRPPRRRANCSSVMLSNAATTSGSN